MKKRKEEEKIYSDNNLNKKNNDNQIMDCYDDLYRCKSQLSCN